MNNYENDDLDFDFEEDDFDSLEDTSEKEDTEALKQENIQENIRIADEKLSTDDSEDDIPLEVISQQSEEEQVESVKELVLYVVTDRLMPNLQNYFRSSGVKVSKVFNDIKEAGDQLMFEMDPCRLVIIDTGLGKFTGVASRKDVIDVLSMVDDEHYMSVFYTDKFLKNEVKDSTEVDYKEINWYKYKSTADTVARLLLSKEKYILGSDVDEDNETEENILDMKATPQLIKDSNRSIGGPSITEDQLLKNLENPDFEEVKAFKVHY